MKNEKTHNTISEKIIRENEYLVEVQRNYMDFMDNIITDATKRKKIQVSPERCGIGKSTLIKYFVFDSAQKNKGKIIITDSVKRLEECVSKPQKMQNDEYNTLMQKIVTLKSQNIADGMKNIAYRPVVLMTTQRFFNLTEEEKNNLLCWNGGKRDQIIFDEKPYLFEMIEVSIKTLNDILSALQDGIDNSTQLKSWVVGQFKNLYKKIETALLDYEKMGNGKKQFYLWYTSNNCMTENDNLFMEFIVKHKNELESFMSETYKRILALQQLVYNGAIFEAKNRKSGNYGKGFVIMMDHRKEILDIDAQVMIFDATANIDLEYDNQEIFEMISDENFNVRLDNLVIDCVNVSTSKNSFVRNTEKSKGITAAVKDYILSNATNTNTVALFTYAETEKRFPEFNIVGHFGNLRGFNDYRNCNIVAQVGLNRFPQLYYYLINSANGNTTLEDIKQMSHEEQMIEFEKSIMRRDTKADHTDYKTAFFILTDLEQNIFRSAIRSINCVDKIHIILFFNTIEYRNLVELINARYGDLGATINLIGMPQTLKIEKIKNRNTKDKSVSQRIIDWIDLQSKRIFKTKELLLEVGITKEQYKSARKSNKALNELFIKISTAKRGYFEIK